MRKEERNKEHPFKGIKFLVILILIFVIIVVSLIFIYLFMYGYASANQCEEYILYKDLADMQGITLTIATIAVTFVSGIASILMFYQEKKSEIINTKVEQEAKEINEEVKKNILEIELERTYLTQLIYLISNNSSYLLGTQYEHLFNLGRNIATQNFPTKQYMLYVVASLLERQAEDSKNIDIDPENLYEQVIDLMKPVILDNDLPESEKINARCMMVHAHYRIFRDQYVKNPDWTNIDHLDKAISCIGDIPLIYGNKMSSVQLNAIGLVYYWKFNYLFGKNKDTEELDNLINSAVNYFEQAIRKNQNNDQICNNYGCSLIGFSKYYFAKEDSNLGDFFLDRAEDQFKKALHISPNYEKPYINLMDICCLKIRSILGVTTDPYLLRPCLNMDIPISNIQNLIKHGQGLYENAIKSGKLLFNIYYKMAELKIYELFLSLKEKNQNSDSLKKEVLHYLDLSEKDKKTIKVLLKKRQLYELLNEDTNMKMINNEIRNIDSKNAQLWESLL